jgi:hypothetical protein
VKTCNTLCLIFIICFGITAHNNIFASDLSKLPDIVEIEYDLIYEFIPKRTSSLKRILNTVLGNRPEMKLIVNLPQTIEKRQKITKLEFEPLPSKVFIENGNKYAEYVIPLPKEMTRLKIHVEAETFQYNLSVAINDPNQRSFDDSNLDMYLQHERMIEKDDPVIRDIAEKLQGKTEVDIVKNIYKYVILNLSGDVSNPKGVGAVKTVKIKRGKCIDYSDLFVALCRAKNIPARVVAGYSPFSNVDPKHSWAEVYFREYGWVPFNVALTHEGPEELLDRVFYDFKKPFLLFTDIRNDKLLKNRYFWCPYSDSNFNKRIRTVKEWVEFKKPLQKQHTF